MAGSGGAQYYAMTKLNNKATNHTAIEIYTATAPPTCWERLQRWLFGQMVNMELIEATIEGKYEDCKKILENGAANINTEDEETKQTALHYASQCGKLKFVRLLLEHNADCNAQDNLGNTPLHLAIQHGHYNCCKRILECDNLQINLANKAQDTPLHLAAKDGKLKFVELLLEYNANCNAQDSLGNTPLHLAIHHCQHNCPKRIDGDHNNCSEKTDHGHHYCCKRILECDNLQINLFNEAQDTPLHLAARKGYMDIVDKLLGMKPDYKALDSLGNTMLHLTAASGHLNYCTKFLQQYPEKINAKNNIDSTPLHCAAKAGNSNIVALLLDYDAQCNAQDSSGDTPLHLAVTKGHEDCCKKLLGCSDLKINEKNKAHEAPLHTAAKVGRRNVCDLILQYSGVNINIIKNKMHQTPLYLATQHNNYEVVELLLNKGADWKLRDKQAYMPLHYAAEKGYDKLCEYLMKAFKKAEKSKGLKLKDKKTPLMLAAKGGYHRCCEILLLDDINDQDKFGNTALFYATEGDLINTVSFLLEKNADITIKNHAGRTVLHQAAKNRADKCLLHLLQNPKACEVLLVKDKENSYTPFHEAINNEALECAKILLECGASLTDTCKNGMTPLHLAAKQGDPGICSLLVSHEIDVNKENDHQETPLLVAAMYGHKDACRILMKKDTRVLATNKDGRTALHLAADRGHEQVVIFLMKKGVSPLVKDDDGSTALHLAAAKGHLKCCQTLVANGNRLILEADNENKLSIDKAFENKHDEVFAYLIRKLMPKKEINVDLSPQSPVHRNTLENEERRNRFHKYMHQSLKPENHQNPRLIAAEGILESEWWTAAFFPGMKINTNTNTQGKKQYCTNFHELINNHPSLALMAQNRCYESPSGKAGLTQHFRLFEDNICAETGQKTSVKQQALTDGQRLLREHPVSLMVQHTRAELLQHPLTEAWLMYLWRTCISYIFTFLLSIEVLFLISLNVFMDNVDNWDQIQHKCNITQEQFCGVSFLPVEADTTSNGTEATEEETTFRMISSDRNRSFGACYRQSSTRQFITWLFLFIMTCFILFFEGIYFYRLRAEYFQMKRSLRIFQVILTILSLLPIGICRFQHQVLHTWQWYCGIIALLLEWILLIDKLNQLPVLFVFMPVTKFFLWTYVKALGYILLLLFAFSYIFHLLLADQTAFRSMPEAMMKMIVWLLGDLNYDDTFVDSHLIHPSMAKPMLGAFIIIMGVFIANLAIAQPSDRLDEFRKGASFYQKAAQSTLFLEIKACFPHIKKLITKVADGNESRINNLADKLAKKIFTTNIIDEKSMSPDTTRQNLEDQVATLVNLCTEQREELKELKQQLNVLFKRMPEYSPSS